MIPQFPTVNVLPLLPSFGIVRMDDDFRDAYFPWAIESLLPFLMPTIIAKENAERDSL